MGIKQRERVYGGPRRGSVGPSEERRECFGLFCMVFELVLGKRVHALV